MADTSMAHGGNSLPSSPSWEKSNAGTTGRDDTRQAGLGGKPPGGWGSLILQCITALGAIATAAGVAVAVVVYIGTLQQGRVSASLNYYLQYTQGDLLESKQSLRGVLTERVMRSADFVGGRDMIESDVHEAIFNSEPSLENELIDVVSYFDAASRCISGNVCDAETLRAQLGPDAISLQCYFSAAISHLRSTRGYTNLGSGLGSIGRSDDCIIVAASNDPDS